MCRSLSSSAGWQRRCDVNGHVPDRRAACRGRRSLRARWLRSRRRCAAARAGRVIPNAPGYRARVRRYPAHASDLRALACARPTRARAHRGPLAVRRFGSRLHRMRAVQRQLTGGADVGVRRRCAIATATNTIRAPTQTAAKSCALSGRTAVPAQATDGKPAMTSMPNAGRRACKPLFLCEPIAAIVQHRATAREIDVRPIGSSFKPPPKCPSKGTFFKGVRSSIRH